MLTREAAAAMMGLKVHTLDVWRCEGNGPSFVRMGRSIRYRESAVAAYLTAREVNVPDPKARELETAAR
jgi:predicted DNA-binding transcriptional regulator AlpA